MLELIADAMLFTAACGSGLYCLLLSRKLNKLNGFDSGLGGAIAVLSKQVDEMKAALEATERSARDATGGLQDVLQDAEAAAERLDMLMASLHDLPEAAPAKPAEPAPVMFARASRRGQGT